jgi:hypothetical protein
MSTNEILKKMIPDALAAVRYCNQDNPDCEVIVRNYKNDAKYKKNTKNIMEDAVRYQIGNAAGLGLGYCYLPSEQTFDRWVDEAAYAGCTDVITAMNAINNMYREYLDNSQSNKRLKTIYINLMRVNDIIYCYNKWLALRNNQFDCLFTGRYALFRDENILMSFKLRFG